MNKFKVGDSVCCKAVGKFSNTPMQIVEIKLQDEFPDLLDDTASCTWIVGNVLQKYDFFLDALKPVKGGE